MKPKTLHAIFLICAFCSACVSPSKEDSTTVEPSPIPDATAIPTTAPILDPTSVPPILAQDEVHADSPFCQPESGESAFILTCADQIIQFNQSEKRRGSDVIIKRAIETEVDGFTLTAEITSNPADPARLDKNQTGIYFIDTDGRTFALRLEGQFFNFEEWLVENGKEKTRALNQTYTPELQPAGRKNNLRLTCVSGNCDVFAEDNLIGRLPLPERNGFSVIGIFAASPWDEQFGSVSIADLRIEPESTVRAETQPYVLIDDLRADHGTFAQMGLSGAFSAFDEDGFHFSPVIPYGYYATKAGPALRNVSVTATIEMEFSPGAPATRYGGVVCRASNEGMVMAVLRADGTYTIYRDSVRRAFAMLATESIPSIKQGRSAHRLRLNCIDDTIALFIDEVEVESFTDTKFAIEYGRSGLYTKAGGAAYTDAIIFSDLEIKEIR